MTVDSALNILQPALDRCRVEDIRTPGIYSALTFLEGCTAVKWPFDNFRSALESGHTTTLEREALWQILHASFNGMHRSVEGMKPR
jgi:hypothetical protein